MPAQDRMALTGMAQWRLPKRRISSWSLVLVLGSRAMRSALARACRPCGLRMNA
jgi:hypothetical protein